MKTKRKKLPENKTTTLTISLLPEFKQKLIDFVGNGNLSGFLRDAAEKVMNSRK